MQTNSSYLFIVMDDLDMLNLNNNTMSDTEQQQRPKSTQLATQHEEEQERQRERDREEPEIKMQDIMHEVDPKMHPLPQVEVRASHVPPPTIINPIYYYNGHTKYNWRLTELDPTAIVEQLHTEPIPYTDQLPFANDIDISITETPVTASGINKHIGYTARKRDKNGQGVFTRRYTEYIALRKKLAQLCPGVFIPCMPSKTLLGSSEEQVIRSRIKYIHHFWRKVSFYDRVYYSEEVALFMDDNVNVEATYQRIQQPKVADLLEKYKNAFPEAYQNCHREEFMYKKDQAPVIFQEFQTYFGKKKIELVQFKDSFMRLADLKSKYIRAVSKLNQTLLPSYQSVLFRWFNGQPIEDKQPSLMERMSRKLQERKSQERASKTEEMKEVQKEVQKDIPIPVVLEEQPSQKHQEFPLPLYNSEAYKSKLEDTAHLIQDYNSSVWVLYDVLKFELKDIDTVILALQQVRYVQKQIEYLKRSIAVNREQIQSLNNRKTTLKTFFMGGSQDDKKSKLANESQAFEQRLQKSVEYYHILLALVQQQLVRYHAQRVEYYTRAVKKALADELGIARTVMDFHIYEYQLFAKERHRKLQELYPQAQLRVEEEIKE